MKKVIIGLLFILSTSSLFADYDIPYTYKTQELEITGYKDVCYHWKDLGDGLECVATRKEPIYGWKTVTKTGSITITDGVDPSTMGTLIPDPDGDGSILDLGELDDDLLTGGPTDEELEKLGLSEDEYYQKKDEYLSSSQLENEKPLQTTGGDPVRLPSGEFVTSENDFEIISNLNATSIKRNFSGNNTSSHSFGRGWNFNYDTRIIRGESFEIEIVVSQAQSTHDVISSFLEDTINSYDLIIGTSSNPGSAVINYNNFVSTKGQIDESIISLQNVLQTAPSGAKDEIQADLTIMESYKTQIDAVITSLYNEIQTVKENYSIEIIKLKEKEIASKELLDFWLGVQRISELNSGLNKFTFNDTDPDEYRFIGFNSLTVVDAGGTPYTYLLDDDPNYNSTNVHEDGTINYWPEGSSATPLVESKDTLILLSTGEIKLTKKNGDIFLYDIYGQLESITDRNNNITRFTFIEGAINKIIDCFGREVVFVTDGSGRILSITGPENSSISYSYNEEGRINAVTDLDGDTVQYTYYSDTGEIKKITKPDLSFRKYNYITQDGKRVVTSTEDEEGDIEYFTYDFENGHSIYQDPAGIIEHHYYDDRNRETKVVYGDSSYTEKTYDEDNNIVSSRSRSGYTTYFEYDNMSNVTRIEYPDGTYETRKYNSYSQVTERIDSEGNTFSNIYDEQGNLLSAKLYSNNRDLESEKSFIYNDKGLVISKSTKTLIDEHNISEFFTYDKNGNIALVTDGEGNIWPYDYDSIGNLLSVTDPEENTTSYEYTPSGRISKISYPDGTTEQTFYSNRKDVDYVIDRDGLRFEYTYNKKHSLLSVENPLGQSVVYTYDPLGKVESKSVLSETGDLEAFSEYVYDSVTGELITERKQLDEVTYAETEYEYYKGLVWKVTDPNQTTTEYLYDNRDRVEIMTTDHETLSTPVKEYFDYTDRGQLEVYTNPRGAATEYDYTATGQVSQIYYPDNSMKEYVYDGLGRLTSLKDEEEYTTEYEYDDRGKRIATVYSDGTREEWSYSNAGFIQSYSDRNDTIFSYDVDPFGQVVTVNLPDPYEGLTEEYTYNTRGQVLTSKDPKGNIWTNVYDELGNLIQVIDPEEKITENSYTPLGQIFQTKTPDSAVWEREYDMAGRTTATVDPLENKTHYTYDDAGNLLYKEDPLLRRDSYTYNGLGQLATVRDGEGSGVDYEYDLSGNLVKETQTSGLPYEYIYDKRNRLEKEINRLGAEKTYEYYNNGQIKQIIDFNGNATTFIYDEAARLEEKRFSDGTAENFTYDGNGNTLTALNAFAELEYVYDPLGRMVQSVDHFKDEQISYEYDPNGNRTSLSWSDGNRTTSWEYDALNRAVSMTDPEGERTRFSYDVMSRETERNLPNGVTRKTSYDIAGQMIAISHSGGKRHEILPARFYSYNNAGQKVLQLEESGHLTSWEYDDAGRLAESSSAFAGGNSLTDFWDRVYLGVIPEDLGKGHHENSIDDLIKSLDREYSVLKELGFKKNDFLHEIDNTFKDLSLAFPELDKRKSKSLEQFDSNYLVDADWAFIADELPQNISSLYDSRHLTDILEQPLWVEKFTYDEQGNITRKSNGWGALNYTYNDENQLIQAGERQYEYDANGNQTREWVNDLNASYSYDGENRQVAISANYQGFLGRHKELMNMDIEYSYDAFGRRIRRDETLEQDTRRHGKYGLMGENLNYLYDGMSFDILAEGFNPSDINEPINKHYSSGETFSPTSEYLRTNGQVIVRNDEKNKNHAIVNPRNHNSVVKNYLTQDSLGSIIGIFDERGNVDMTYSYDSFGRLTNGEFDDFNRLGYNGKMIDPVLGVYDYGFRDYSPQQMRFTTVDPVKAGINWYSYVSNDPINKIDPFGLEESDNLPTVFETPLPDPTDPVPITSDPVLPSDPISPGGYSITDRIPFRRHEWVYRKEEHVILPDGDIYATITSDCMDDGCNSVLQESWTLHDQ